MLDKKESGFTKDAASKGALPINPRHFTRRALHWVRDI